MSTPVNIAEVRRAFHGLVSLVSLVVAGAICCAVVDCSDLVSATHPPNITAFVVGAAAAALEPDGTFRLADPPAGMVAPSQARALAAAYIRDVGIFFVASWELDHGGGRIDYIHLSPCGRTFFANSPYAAVASSTGLSIRQRFSSSLLTTFCSSSGDPEVSVGVPVIDTTLRIDADGHIVNLGQANFFSGGVPPGVALPQVPEEVVENVAKQTNRRVAQVPELIEPPFPYAPQLAKWRIELESPMTFRKLHGDTTHIALSEVYFGYGATVASKGLQVGQRCAPTHITLEDSASTNDSVTVSLADGYDNCFFQIDTVGQRTAMRRN